LAYEEGFFGRNVCRRGRGGNKGGKGVYNLHFRKSTRVQSQRGVNLEDVLARNASEKEKEQEEGGVQNG